MNSKTIYAVVDLEATGTSIRHGDRIIQFSCSFVQHQRIIDNFSTLINPLIPIPDDITRLTGITNQMVRSAPVFSDVAVLISNLLRDTVFVAHNVNFDFPFLNAELRRNHLPALPIKAIDTVTMSQILFPTLPSYQLRRISAYFNIVHRHPHSASSDASATADLLILLINRLHHLPFVTLSRIIRIHPRLPRNTFEMFIRASKYQKRHGKVYPSFLKNRRGVSLRRLTFFSGKRSKLDNQPFRYPEGRYAKIKIFKNWLRWHARQIRIMDWLYQNFTSQRPRNGLFEIPNGVERRIDYALPMAYLSHNQHQTVIVSTQSPITRDRLLRRTLPFLNKVLPFRISVLQLKSPHHYLDLNRFVNTLNFRYRSVLSQLIRAKILMWLNITRTGDLSELHINSSIPYLNEVRCWQNRVSKRHNPFYRNEPLQLLLHQAKRVDFVIVTHKYLYQHAKQLSRLSSRPFLVVDEAARLNATVLGLNSFSLRFNTLPLVIHRVLSDLHRSHGPNLSDILPQRSAVTFRLRLLDREVNRLDRTYRKFCHAFAITFLSANRLRKRGKQLEDILQPATLEKFFNAHNHQLQMINRDIHTMNRTVGYIQHVSQRQNYHGVDRIKLINFSHHVALINRFCHQINRLIHRADSHSKNYSFKVITSQPHDISQCLLRNGIIHLTNQLRSGIYRYFQPAIFTDHALIPKHSHFMLNQLELPKSAVKLITCTGLHQVKVNLKPKNSAQEVVKDLVNDEKQRPKRILVDFSSVQSRERVLTAFGNQPHSGLSIYAPGVTGSLHRIAERLLNYKNVIVLVRNWQLDQLLFTHPAWFKHLAIAELPSITRRQISVPRSVLLIKETLGVSRSLTILDRRLSDAATAQKLITGLPKNVLFSR